MTAGRLKALHTGTNVCDNAATFVATAKKSVEIASYVWPTELDADLTALHLKGIPIRLVTDRTVYDPKETQRRLVPQYPWRLTLVHAKFIIVDKRSVFLGSSNFTRTPRVETAVVLTGSVVRELKRVFDRMWVGAESIEDVTTPSGKRRYRKVVKAWR